MPPIPLGSHFFDIFPVLVVFPVLDFQRLQILVPEPVVELLDGLERAETRKGPGDV
jgi:hypothetical protein